MYPDVHPHRGYVGTPQKKHRPVLKTQPAMIDGWAAASPPRRMDRHRLEIPQDRRSQVHTRELATLMDKLGYERCQFQKRVGGKKVLRRGFIMKRFADDCDLRSKITSVLLG